MFVMIDLCVVAVLVSVMVDVAPGLAIVVPEQDEEDPNQIKTKKA